MQIFVPLDRYDEALTRIETDSQGQTGATRERISQRRRSTLTTLSDPLGAFLLVDFPLAFSFVFVLPRCR